jgi:large subunit ribosomal protein L15
MSNELSTMKPLPGERRDRMRIGRGEGSGKGKTAGKGTKGAQARSGYSYRDRFEGGQMPLARRLPKKGFKNPFAKEYTEVRVGRLAVFPAGTTVTPELLREAGVVKDIRKDGVKIVGGG